jgi:RNA polymerase sigma-70 factor (ECF subfamily)
MSDARPARDTHLAGGNRDFPSTCWSRFDRSAGNADGEAAVTELARHYWTPIYAYIRARWGRSNEEAKDLTQEFFAWVIESGFIGKADPRRGRFRVFVKAALEHFVINEARDAGRLKRGGGRFAIPLEGLPEEPSTTQRTPDRILDEVWRNGLLSRAETALDDALTRENRALTLKLFRDYCQPEGDGFTYGELAKRHGVTEGDVLVHLRHARKRYRAILEDLVADTVRSADELAEELRVLFGEEPA